MAIIKAKIDAGEDMPEYSHYESLEAWKEGVKLIEAEAFKFYVLNFTESK